MNVASVPALKFEEAIKASHVQLVKLERQTDFTRLIVGGLHERYGV